MLLKLLVLCISAVLAAEQVNMDLTDDSTFVDQATVRQREPTKMEVEFVEETGTPLESANGLEITELTEDVANAVRPQESGQRTPLPLLSENYLPSTPRYDIASAPAGYSSRQQVSSPPFRKAYSPSYSIPSGYNVRPMANGNYETGCAGPSVHTTFQVQRMVPSRPVQVMSSYVAGPPSVPYSQQGTAVRTGYGRRRKRSPTFLALRKSLKG